MHETALMHDVLRTLEKSAEENDIEEITELKLVIGSLSCIMPEALRFAFDSFKGKPPLAGEAVLEIEVRYPEARCEECGESFVLSSPFDFECPNCDSFEVKIDAGEELYIEYYKGREKSA